MKSTIAPSTKNTLILLLMTFSFNNVSFAQNKKEYVFTLKTKYGELPFVLFNTAPIHKENFLKKTQEGFYNGLVFHRIIEGFMLQGGDPNFKSEEKTALLGNGCADLPKIKYEFDPRHVHTKGAIAAARTTNPEKASNPCQFYIVQGKKIDEPSLLGFEERIKIKYTEEQKNAYKTFGGTPFLDGEYTVFGTVIGNLDLIDKMIHVETDASNRPKENLIMEIDVKRRSVKKIYKTYGYRVIE